MNRALLPAIALRLLAAFLIVAMSAAVRAASSHAPVGQIMFWRSSVAVVPIVIYMLLRSEFPTALRTRYPMLQLSRAVVGVFAMAMAFTSLSYLPVSMSEGLAALAPLMVLPLAALFLGEQISRRAVIATCIGLAGALAILARAMSLPGEGALLGVAAGLAFALSSAVARILAKQLSGVERASTIAIYFAVAGSVAGLATLPFGWAEQSAHTMRYLVLAGVLGGCGHIAATESLRRAPISVLGPFEYTGLIWAAGFDIVLFNTYPGLLGWTGIALVCLAGLMILRSRARLP